VGEIDGDGEPDRSTGGDALGSESMSSMIEYSSVGNSSVPRANRNCSRPQQSPAADFNRQGESSVDIRQEWMVSDLAMVAPQL
jgi:hypothetical protein